MDHRQAARKVLRVPITRLPVLPDRLVALVERGQPGRQVHRRQDPTALMAAQAQPVRRAIPAAQARKDLLVIRAQPAQPEGQGLPVAWVIWARLVQWGRKDRKDR